MVYDSMQYDLEIFPGISAIAWEVLPLKTNFYHFAKAGKSNAGTKENLRVLSRQKTSFVTMFSHWSTCAVVIAVVEEKERAPRVLRIREGINSPKNHRTEPFCYFCLDCQVLPSLNWTKICCFLKRRSYRSLLH